MSESTLIENFFDGIFVISLKRCHDRRQRLMAHLSKIGGSHFAQKIIFIDGIEPMASTPPFDDENIMGCFLSHLSLLEQAQKSGYERILILEDDCLIHRSFFTDAETVIGELTRKEWNAVFFGHFRNDLSSSLMGKQNKFVHISDCYAAVWFYGINRTGINQLVKLLHELLKDPPGYVVDRRFHFDAAMGFLVGSKPAVTFLAACIPYGTHGKSISNITPGKMSKLGIPLLIQKGMNTVIWQFQSMSARRK
jgi:GR25 family glycosyltransferase involved in LPS biosynthesis